MGIDDDIPRLLPVGVQKPKPPGSLLPFPQRLCPGVSHDHTLAAGVKANVVGVVRALYARKKFKCGPVVDIRDAVKTASDEQTIGGRIVEHSLRLRQIGNRVHLLSGLQIDHFKGVVGNGGHEETLPLQVDAEVIDASLDVRQCNVGFQRQSWGLLTGGRAAQIEQSCEEQRCGEVFHWVSFKDLIPIYSTSYSVRQGERSGQ